MARPSDGGKGSDRRRENGDVYRHNHDKIDWSKKVTPPTPQRKHQAQARRWAFDLHSYDE